MDTLPPYNIGLADQLPCDAFLVKSVENGSHNVTLTLIASDPALNDGWEPQLHISSILYVVREDDHSSC